MIHHINPAWWGFTRLTARTFHIYRLQSLTWCISIIIQLYLLRVVWAGVYADRDMLVGISEKTLLVYLTISALHRFFLPNLIDFYIQERVTSGRVAHDLVRPFGFVKQMIAMQVGSAVVYCHSLS
jgi:ABC-2 type transport system permease protein